MPMHILLRFPSKIVSSHYVAESVKGLHVQYLPDSVPKVYDTLVLTDILDETSRSSVYGGHYEAQDGSVYSPNGTGFRVVVKFGELDRSKLEVDSYIRMKDLQGRAVPMFLGFYKASTIWNKDLGCIILERFGQSLTMPFYLLEKEEKYMLCLPLSDSY